MKPNKLFTMLCAVAFAVASCDSKKDEKAVAEKPVDMQIKEDTALYNLDTVGMVGYVAWDASSDKQRPVVLVVPEWWGLNDYTKSRVKQLAGLGYLAFAVDMYGNGMQAADPGQAEKLATPFYKDPTMAKSRFDAAMTKALSYAVADKGKVAAIGYCFGGTQVLNMALLGEPLKGVVSFHGGLETVPADKGLLKANILVCHGEADNFVPADQVAAFRKKLDSIAAPYSFKTYPGATHAFSNPGATATGKKFNMPISYNAAADTASWNEMKAFFGTIFK
ncbi:MAG: dienelactone hydrolase family protein [Chitinophagaceae bacterium]|nr:MAG: dienelactone hydrolase family protein [Chitinophagaceae bacterium]